MSRYFLSRISRLWVLIMCVWLVSGCVSNDSLFGNGMVPPSQQMSTRLDSSFHVQTHIFKLDSVNTTNFITILWVGSTLDSLVGQTSYAAYSNYVAMGFDNDDTYFGKDAVVDSMIMSLSFSTDLGDTLSPITIDVYEVVNHWLNSDSTYYSNYDLTPYLNPVPIVSFDIHKKMSVRKHLPLEFALKHFDNEDRDDNIYNADTLFTKRANGLYFKVRTPSPKGLAVALDLSSSVMDLWYHSTNKEGIVDTLYQRMFFSVKASEVPASLCFATTEHDYSKADPSKGGVRVESIDDMTTESEYCYIQALAGLGGKVRFLQEDIDRLKEKVKAEGYNSIGIHKAELRYMVSNPRWETYDASWAKLAMYVNFNIGKFLPDYDPVMEQTYKIPQRLGGALVRSEGYYSMDITSYMQRLIGGRSVELELQVLPPFMQKMDINVAKIYGSASANPPQLILTYTMLK